MFVPNLYPNLYPNCPDNAYLHLISPFVTY